MSRWTQANSRQRLPHGFGVHYRNGYRCLARPALASTKRTCKELRVKLNEKKNVGKETPSSQMPNMKFFEINFCFSYRAACPHWERTSSYPVPVAVAVAQSKRPDTALNVMMHLRFFRLVIIAWHLMLPHWRRFWLIYSLTLSSSSLCPFPWPLLLPLGWQRQQMTENHHKANSKERWQTRQDKETGTPLSTDDSSPISMENAQFYWAADWQNGYNDESRFQWLTKAFLLRLCELSFLRNKLLIKRLFLVSLN